ncbi:hypothetical protein JX266_006475 [Neoarthrinium moseri]|nr:hypothetical protein JX266_006475 [Neoarthrinium moseri]
MPAGRSLREYAAFVRRLDYPPLFVSFLTAPPDASSTSIEPKQHSMSPTRYHLLRSISFAFFSLLLLLVAILFLRNASGTWMGFPWSSTSGSVRTLHNDVLLLGGARGDMYSFLGVSQNARPEEIHAAFEQRTRALAWRASKQKDREQTLLGAIYGVLANDKTRAEYDKFLQSEGRLLVERHGPAQCSFRRHGKWCSNTCSATLKVSTGPPWRGLGTEPNGGMQTGSPPRLVFGSQAASRPPQARRITNLHNIFSPGMGLQDSLTPPRFCELAATCPTPETSIQHQ